MFRFFFFVDNIFFHLENKSKEQFSVFCFVVKQRMQVAADDFQKVSPLKLNP